MRLYNRLGNSALFQDSCGFSCSLMQEGRGKLVALMLEGFWSIWDYRVYVCMYISIYIGLYGI